MYKLRCKTTRLLSMHCRNTCVDINIRNIYFVTNKCEHIKSVLHSLQSMNTGTKNNSKMCIKVYLNGKNKDANNKKLM